MKLFGSTISTDSLVVERNPRGLTPRDGRGQRQGGGAARRKGVEAAAPIANVPIPGVRWRRAEHDADHVPVPRSGAQPRRARTRSRTSYADSLPQPANGATRGVTGSGPARLAQFEAIDDVLPWIEVATIAVILIVVALYFRSLGAPLVTLACAGLAYVIAVRVLAWSGERADVTAPSEIEPVLVVLLLGARHRLHGVLHVGDAAAPAPRATSRLPAARAATARIAPLVLIAGLLVAGGALSLLAGEMQFFRVFGPALALSALVVTLVCVTLVPALLALVGPWLFGRRARARSAPEPTNGARPAAATRFSGSAARSTRAAVRRGRGRSVALRSSSGCWPPAPRPRCSPRSASPRCCLPRAACARPTSRSRSSPRCRPTASRGRPATPRRPASCPASSLRPRSSSRASRLDRDALRCGCRASWPSSPASPPCSDRRRRRSRSSSASSCHTGRRRGALRRAHARRADRRRGDRDVHPPARPDARARRSRGPARRARVLRGRDGAGAGDRRLARRRSAPRRASSRRSRCSSCSRSSSERCSLRCCCCSAACSRAPRRSGSPRCSCPAATSSITCRSSAR